MFCNSSWFFVKNSFVVFVTEFLLLHEVHEEGTKLHEDVRFKREKV